MRIDRVQATNLRRIRAADLAPATELNLIVGQNGSGKTSLLEGIHLLGYGRSFRTRRVGEVVRHGESGLSAHCQVVDGDGVVSHIGIEKSGTRTRIRVNGEDIKATSILARMLPAVFIGPDCLRLLTDGGEHRRRLLDWVMFHVEPRYLDAYQRFHRALKQRNALLRVQGHGLEPWTQQLGEAGEEVHRFRAEHTERLSAFAAAFLRDLLPMEIGLDYEPGWDVERPLVEALAATVGQDRRLGFTRLGPQRADLAISSGAQPARSILSRGESRLLTMGLHLAQAAYFTELRGEPPILLVDDLGTELDDQSCGKFIAAMGRTRAQAFVTTVSDPSRLLAVRERGDGHAASVVETEQVSPGDGSPEVGTGTDRTASSVGGDARPVGKFHVEQGVVTQVI